MDCTALAAAVIGRQVAIVRLLLQVSLFLVLNIRMTRWRGLSFFAINFSTHSEYIDSGKCKSIYNMKQFNFESVMHDLHCRLSMRYKI